MYTLKQCYRYFKDENILVMILEEIQAYNFPQSYIFNPRVCTVLVMKILY